MCIFTLRLTRKCGQRNFRLELSGSRRYASEISDGLSVLFPYECSLERFLLYFPDIINSGGKRLCCSTLRALGDTPYRLFVSQSCKWPNVLYIFDSKVLEFLSSRLHQVGTRSIFYAPVTTATTTSCRVYEMRSDRAVDERSKRGSGSGGRKQRVAYADDLSRCELLRSKNTAFPGCLINDRAYLSTGVMRGPYTYTRVARRR